MFSISVWFERVASERNCADAPSRNVRLTFPARHDGPFGPLEEFRSIQKSIFSESFEVLAHNGSIDRASTIDSGNPVASIDMEIDSDDEHV